MVRVRVRVTVRVSHQPPAAGSLTESRWATLALDVSQHRMSVGSEPHVYTLLVSEATNANTNINTNTNINIITNIKNKVMRNGGGGGGVCL